MDTSKVGIIAAEFMDKLEKESTHEGVIPGSLELGELVIVGEVHWSETDGTDRQCVVTASTTPNRIHQSGILQWGTDLVMDFGVAAEDDD